MPGGAGRQATDQRRLVSMLDIAPTVLDLAGVQVPADIQGRSMKPLLRGEPTELARRVLLSLLRQSSVRPAPTTGSPTTKSSASARKTAKLVYYPTWKDGPFWEYFDLAHDPAGNAQPLWRPVAQKEVAALKQIFRELAGQYHDTTVIQRFDAKTEERQ